MALPPHEASLVLVDDHRAMREALAKVLEDGGLPVSAQADGREETLACVAVERPDLVVVDLSLSDEGGLSLVSELRDMGIPVIVCSDREDADNVHRALAAGARAYVSKREAAVALPRAVRDVLDGWVLVSPRAADDLGMGP